MCKCSQSYEDGRALCKHSVLKKQAVFETVAMVDSIQEMTAEKYCKCGNCGSFEPVVDLVTEQAGKGCAWKSCSRHS